MKIIYKQGDLIECTEKVVVHGCNAQGVMGSGVALAIKNKYPSAYSAYKASEQYGGMTLGRCSYSIQDDGKVVINAITQQFYGRNPHIKYVSYEAVAEAFNMINMFCEERGYKEVAIPKIGAGLANGDWDVIENIIEAECVDVQVVCYVL